MSKAGGDRDPIDLDALRKQLARKDTDAAPQKREPVTLNPLARQVANQLRGTSHSPNIVIGQLRLFEFVVLTVIGILISALAVPDAFMSRIALLAICVWNGAFCSILLQLTDSYQLPSLRRPLDTLPRIQGSLLASFVLTSVFLPTGSYTWQTLGLWYGISAVFLLLERIIVGLAIRHWGRNGVMERRAVIVGGGQAAKDLIRSLEQHDNDIRICGIFDDRKSARSPEVVAGYPKLGTFAELVEFARLTKLDMLIISIPMSAEARILELIRQLWVLPVDIRIAAHANKLRFRPRSYSHIGKVPMLDVMDKPLRDWDSVAKRLFDVVFSIICIAILWPVMLGAAIAVKSTSKGPILFKQKRHGFNNETINVWKFRSMYTEMSDPTAMKAVTKNDPRVTPVGRFLRKSSIDELPQLINVLMGDLSLVGPRPHAVHAQTGDLKYTEVVEHYFARHKVKPGVTGWAQINGWRGEIDHGDKIKYRTAHDLYYIENWSLLLDLKILVLTPIRLLKSENAY
ncbi:undecaprenyl-phosphate glucose phosphotransferase [Agrobacterium sp. rho-13.3]|uniref:undecaprenyl-phosphate glucose phosphotransferase n=1 Tax=Agrobacterium sp. rho-13.3 TaxID=3072980 RepID=UPI002A10EF61|nr:undecaprenyl-phosphate glucose phosphotransferase [Agrobacterium sp. rho-13.3]MDX8311832.1 undecaprenyl-phosphate glucose phosphotransferase [Agrobacterium sp. rho-13.3]